METYFPKSAFSMLEKKKGIYCYQLIPFNLSIYFFPFNIPSASRGLRESE